MPKAAVDEHAQPVFWENQVRFARQILPMQTVAKPQFMAHRSHEHFRLRVFALDHRHNLGAVFWGNYVCTQRMRPGLSINSTFYDTASLDFSFFSAEIRSHHCPSRTGSLCSLPLVMFSCTSHGARLEAEIRWSLKAVQDCKQWHIS